MLDNVGAGDGCLPQKEDGSAFPSWFICSGMKASMVVVIKGLLKGSTKFIELF
jgi:hypothetical protein